jgi:Protein of unknown function (DUF3000)
MYMSQPPYRISTTGWHEGTVPAPRPAGMTPAGRSAGPGADSVIDKDAGDNAAATFRSAVDALEAGLNQQCAQRPELTFEQEPAPRKLAPFAAAIAVTVADGGGGEDEVAWGRFVLLYDPEGQRGWDGPFRIIAHIRADLEPEIAADPMVGEVGWSWLTEALDARAPGYRQTSGTVTRVVTEGFGAKQDQPATTEFELRASWSPAWQEPGTVEPATLGIDGHAAAWCEALCAAAGLPPLTAGVSALRQPRSRRS